MTTIRITKSTFLTISCNKTLPSLVNFMSPEPDTNLRIRQQGRITLETNYALLHPYILLLMLISN